MNISTLESRLPLKLNENKFYLFKMAALDRLIKLMGIYERNPYKDGNIPYETNLILLLYLRIHNPNIPKYSFIAASRLLDYYFPIWKQFADPEIIGKSIERGDKLVGKWIRDILKRDDYKCVDCGSLENIQAHHILHWAEYPELRIDMDNGISLCGGCHHKQHPEMGKGLFYNN
jgi:hypothetical protein